MIPSEDAQARKLGKRREYLVTELRGALVLYHPVQDPNRTSKTVAADLAMNLKISSTELRGCRFSCWVEPAEYGVFKSDFRLVAPAEDPSPQGRRS